jgi:hypothetical protein
VAGRGGVPAAMGQRWSNMRNNQSETTAMAVFQSCSSGHRTQAPPWPAVVRLGFRVSGAFCIASRPSTASRVPISCYLGVLLLDRPPRAECSSSPDPTTTSSNLRISSRFGHCEWRARLSSRPAARSVSSPAKHASI